jgi:hypothetical protein
MNLFLKFCGMTSLLMLVLTNYEWINSFYFTDQIKIVASENMID